MTDTDHGYIVSKSLLMGTVEAGLDISAYGDEGYIPKGASPPHRREASDK